MTWVLFHRALASLALPSGMAIALLVAGLLTRRRALAAAALAILVVFSTPVVARALMHSVERHYPPTPPAWGPQADVVFPLGGILKPQARPDSPIEFADSGDRFERALTLYFAGRAPELLLSATRLRSGFPSEGELLRREAIARGVPPAAIMVTRETPDTASEEETFCELAPRFHWRRLLLVTSGFHMWRAMHLFQKCPVETFPAPVGYAGLAPFWPLTLEDLLPQTGALVDSERVFKEYEGMIFYAVTGK